MLADKASHMYVHSYFFDRWRFLKLQLTSAPIAPMVCSNNSSSASSSSSARTNVGDGDCHDKERIFERQALVHPLLFAAS